MSFGIAVGSHVASVSATKTFFVGFALSSTTDTVFIRIVSRFGEDFLAVSDVQTDNLHFPRILHSQQRDRWPLHSKMSIIIIGAGTRVRLLMTVTMCALICA